ncbi:MAG TPA: FtsX-like permease family protein [Opitutaceae bacterium]|nr:FtsX-like permease family protein [Opitutaceae bacterium]
MHEIPGVEAVAFAAQPPISARFGTVELSPQGAPPGSRAPAWRFSVSPEFFATMGIRVLEGRVFTAADHLPQARLTYVVDRNFAEKNFPGRSAVGQAFVPSRPGTPPESYPVIIGVVEPARFTGPEDQSGLPFVFEPALRGRLQGFSMLLRTARPLADLLPLMRAQMRAVDSSLPLYDTDTVEIMIERLLSNRRGVMLLFAVFAAIALVLSAVGLYGMLTFDVTQRTREIGIRGAIGASRGQIVALILRQGLGRTCVGLVVGLAGAFLLSRYMASLLFSVEPTDPVTFGAVSLLLLTVAFLASYLPARRAAKVDPIVALRCE